MKKIICLFLITILVIAAVPFAVFAEPEEQQPSNPPVESNPPATEQPTQSPEQPTPPPEQTTPPPQQTTPTPSPTTDPSKLSEPKVTVSISPKELAADGNIQLSVRVENTAGADNPILNVSITVDGSKAFSIEKITKAYTFKNDAYKMSSSKIGKDIPVVVSYNFGGQSAKSVSKAFNVKKGAGVVSISTTAKADKTTVQAGESVGFTFTIVNNSNVPIENAKLTAPGLYGGQQIGETFSLKQKESKTITYSETISASLTTQPQLTYTAGGKQQTANLDMITVDVGSAGVDFTISPSSTTVNAGEDFSVNISVTNTGNVDFESFNIYDCLNNTVYVEQETLKAGEGFSASHIMSLSQTTDVEFYISARDASGNEYSFTSNKVTIEAGMPSSDELAQMLTLEAITDKDTLEEPGDVIFTLTLENKSSQPFTDVVISEQSIGEVERYSSFPNGKKELQYKVTMSESASFVFSLSAVAPDGSLVNITLPSNDIAVEGTGGVNWLTIVLIVVIVLIVATAAVLIILVLREKNGGGGKGKVSGGKPKSGEGFFSSVFGGKKKDDRDELYDDAYSSEPERRYDSGRKASQRSPELKRPQSYDVDSRGAQEEPGENIYKRGSRSYVQGTTTRQSESEQPFEPLKADEPAVRREARNFEVSEDYSEPAIEEPVFEDKNEHAPQRAAAPRAKARNKSSIGFNDHNDF